MRAVLVVVALAGLPVELLGVEDCEVRRGRRGRPRRGGGVVGDGVGSTRGGSSSESPSSASPTAAKAVAATRASDHHAATTIFFTGRSPGQPQGHHHRLERQQRRHVELQHLLARGEDRIDHAQQLLRRGLPGQILDLAAHLLVDQRARRADGQRDRVAVDRGEVHQAAVGDVEDAPLRARLLVLLQRVRRPGSSRGRLPRSNTPYAESRSFFSRASSSVVIASASSLAISLTLVAACMQAPSEVSLAGTARPGAGGGGSPRRGPAPGRVRCGPGWRGRRTPRARPRRGVRTRKRRRRPRAGGQGDQAAARADGGQHVLDASARTAARRCGRGLLDRLQQGVAGACSGQAGRSPRRS